MEAEEVSSLLQSIGRYSSLDAPLSDSDDSGTLYDITENDEPSPENDLLIHSLKSDIERLLKTLPPKESKVLRLSFGINEKHPFSLDEIAEKMGLTRERVRQIRERAIRKLRHSGHVRHLKAYLE
jgi:RNA polymerase primary sigma factor